MAVFTSAYKPLAHGAPNWDTQLRTDMGALEAVLQQNTWAAAFGGGSGATIGSNGGADGYATRIGQTVIYTGRIVFGSSAAFGNAVLTGFNQFVTNNVSWTLGVGWYFFVGDQAHPRSLKLIPQTTSDMQVWVDGTAPARLATLGTPAASDVLQFLLIGSATP